jgi:hypothetical protein
MRQRLWLAALATFTFLIAIACSIGWPPPLPSLVQAQTPTAQAQTPTAQAQTPTEVPADAVPISPLPGSATDYKPPTPTPTPTAVPINPTVTPSPTPAAAGAPVTPIPALPTVPFAPVVPLAPPLPAADPLPTAGEFSDAKMPFRIAILQDYQVTTIGNAVLIESKNGNLAYTALAQPAPAGFASPDVLGEIAKATFKQGEGFQASAPQVIPGGIRMDWSGNLTIGGQSQPVNGLMIAKPTATEVLVLLIAATEAGAGKVPNAAAALVDSFQAVQ